MLTAENLSVQFGERMVLKSMSFEVPRGAVLGIIGPNGAGKTTLIRALSGVIPLASGQVQIDGRPLAQLGAGERARQVAVVPQARHLPPAFTGLEMVQLGRTPYLNFLGRLGPLDDQHVRQALERAQALDLADRRLGELSGGEQQRLMLARALAQEAPVLLLDEPTTHLDLQYQIGLLQAVKDLAEQDGLTVVMALHDLNMIGRYAGRIGLIVDGELQALGAPDEVLDPVLLSRVYHVPLQSVPVGKGGRPIILPTVL
ncbi:MAG: ABC transporter ATP-binding protein [Anaerolineaceae bacterium]|nr:ABC transporter ATP-binding protein [Anaerolineaceae bacterium]